MGEMTNRIALVTGASSGIGLATAATLAREGADVAVLARPEDDLSEAVRLVAEQGRRALPISVDVRDSAAVRAAFDRVEAELGPIDAVLNNAGISRVAPLVDTTDEILDDLLSINVAGSFYVLREAARVMQPRGSGAIVNTGSELALMGQPGFVAYTATKGAIVAMTRSLSQALVEKGIRVNAVAPGPIWTPLIPASFDAEHVAKHGAAAPMKRPGQPNEVAPCYVFLASDDASYMSGQVLHPNGGEVFNT